MEIRPFRALRGEPRFKERRPGLWIDRQVFGAGDSSIVLPLLVGLVRVGEGSAVDLSREEPAADAVSARVGALVSVKSDSEPCLVLTRAPLAAALATTRAPDFTSRRAAGPARFLPINDYAQHVGLQGLVKSAEAETLSGRSLWDAGQQFSARRRRQAAGAKYKLCAIVASGCWRRRPLPVAPMGVLGFEDPVYRVSFEGSAAAEEPTRPCRVKSCRPTS
jgi:hypothetical protein